MLDLQYNVDAFAQSMICQEKYFDSQDALEGTIQKLTRNLSELKALISASHTNMNEISE